MPRTLLLIGAHGFAGRHVARAAEAAGFNVVRAARSGAELTCDLLDQESLAGAIARARPQLIANLAGSASVSASFERPAQAFNANALGTLCLLEATRVTAPDAYVLCISSGEVYGAPEAEDLPLVEDAPLRPVSPYGTSKAAMEIVCAQYARSHGLRIGIARAFNHTGPGQSGTFAASSFARQIAEGEQAEEAIVLRTGNLDVQRDFSDVRDIAAAYVALCERESTGIYNACSGRAVQLRSIVDQLASFSRRPVKIETDPSRIRTDEPESVYGSPVRLRAETGWEASVPLARTLGDLLEWWRRELADAG